MTKNKIDWPTSEEDEKHRKSSLPQIDDNKISKANRIYLFVFATILIICTGLFYMFVMAWTCGINNIGVLDCMYALFIGAFSNGVENALGGVLFLLPIPISIFCIYKAIKG